MSDAMEAEFDTVAEWTAEAARHLGPDHFLPAACRGSGSPAALDWLIDALELTADDVVLDCGAGVGGPAAYAVRNREVRALLVEPEAGACRASAALFGLPVTQASGEALPVADASVDAAWALGVLCTAPDQLGLLAELRRVVRPPGRIGLLVFVATRRITDDELPEGNHFPDAAAHETMFDDAGLTVVARRAAADLPGANDVWEQRQDAVDTEIERLHGDQQAWLVAQEQSAKIGDLIANGAVRATLFSVRHRT